MHFIRKIKSIAGSFNDVGAYWINIGGIALTEPFNPHSSGNGGVTILDTEPDQPTSPETSASSLGNEPRPFVVLRSNKFSCSMALLSVNRPTLFGMMVLTALLTTFMTTALPA